MPLIARWPGHIPAGSERKELFSQVDIMATLADAAEMKLPKAHRRMAAVSWRPLQIRPCAAAKRIEAVFLGTAGFALRQGDWLYIPKQGSGGLTAPETPGKPWSQPY